MKRKNLLSPALAGLLSLSLCLTALADGPVEPPDAGQGESRAEPSAYTDTRDESAPLESPVPEAAVLPPEVPVQSAVPWYAEAQQYVMEQGIMSGSDEGFAPQGIVTRVMAFHALWNLEGTPAEKDVAPFSDVPLACWFQDSASWAQEAGITQGDGAGHYNPYWTITRAELATAFYRYARFKGLDMTAEEDSAYPGYSDALSVPDYASDAFRWAVDRGVINGRIENRIPYLDFSGAATRAELAAMLMRLSRLLNGEAPLQTAS